MRKVLPIVLAVVLLLAATPAFAQLAGTWAGEGTGSCCPRPGTVIYPWQTWKGFIPDEENVFTGEWYDADGNRGIFKGEIEFSPIPEIAYARGAWYWYDPLGPANRPIYGGDFKMTFYFLEDECKGEWTTIWPSPSARGTMKGKKVD